MPFLVRGKARARQYRPKAQAASTVPENTPAPESVASEPAVEENLEDEKVTYQEVTYRVPKEQRLLDLPLEDEVFGEEYEEETSNSEENVYKATPVGEPVSIGVVLKKKKRK